MGGMFGHGRLDSRGRSIDRVGGRVGRWSPCLREPGEFCACRRDRGPRRFEGASVLGVLRFPARLQSGQSGSRLAGRLGGAGKLGGTSTHGRERIGDRFGSLSDRVVLGEVIVDIGAEVVSELVSCAGQGCFGLFNSGRRCGMEGGSVGVGLRRPAARSLALVKVAGRPLDRARRGFRRSGL